MENKKSAKAVALRYNSEIENAPVVVAKGQGVIAERIKAIAMENGVPLREDRPLAEYLMSLDLYEEIPPQLYGVVAEILAFIYRMDQDYRGRER